MSKTVISIKTLNKQYKTGVHALKSVSFDIPQGDFFALLGPNGAGKSTTIGILCGLVTKTSGTVSIDGANIDTHWSNAKMKLGIVPQEFNFNIFETCEQIVINQAGYYGVPRSVALPKTTELFKQLGLTDKAKTQAGKLSGGLKRRLMIARALVHNPKILILDEPTAGVDISLRRTMWQFLKEKNRNGMTIILTTHYLEEAEKLCKNIAILNHGELITHTSMKKLLSQRNNETLILDCQKLPQKIPHINTITLNPIDTHTIEVNIPKTYPMTQLLSQLNTHDIQVNRIQNKTNRLEELFICLTENQKQKEQQCH